MNDKVRELIADRRKAVSWCNKEGGAWAELGEKIKEDADTMQSQVDELADTKHNLRIAKANYAGVAAEIERLEKDNAEKDHALTVAIRVSREDKAKIKRLEGELAIGTSNYETSVDRHLKDREQIERLEDGLKELISYAGAKLGVCSSDRVFDIATQALKRR